MSKIISSKTIVMVKDIAVFSTACSVISTVLAGAAILVFENKKRITGEESDEQFRDKINAIRNGKK